LCRQGHRLDGAALSGRPPEPRQFATKPRGSTTGPTGYPRPKPLRWSSVFSDSSGSARIVAAKLSRLSLGPVPSRAPRPPGLARPTYASSHPGPHRRAVTRPASRHRGQRSPTRQPRSWPQGYSVRSGATPTAARVAPAQLAAGRWSQAATRSATHTSRSTLRYSRRRPIVRLGISPALVKFPGWFTEMHKYLAAWSRSRSAGVMFPGVSIKSSVGPLPDRWEHPRVRPSTRTKSLLDDISHLSGVKRRQPVVARP
jgi:hypothetical protein